MDRITESLLREFASEHGLTALTESKQFEHFASFLVVRAEHSESFDTSSIVVGDDKSSAEGGDSGEAERTFRKESERHSRMYLNTIGV